MKKRPVHPIHPGEVLADELAELDTSPTELARELHVPANRISQLVACKRGMTADTALRLEKWLARIIHHCGQESNGPFCRDEGREL